MQPTITQADRVNQRLLLIVCHCSMLLCGVSDAALSGSSCTETSELRSESTRGHLGFQKKWEGTDDRHKQPSFTRLCVVTSVLR